MIVKFRKLDWTIVVILFLFMVISTLLVYSATKSTNLQNYEIRNLILYAFGFMVFLVFSYIDYRILVKYAAYLYGFGLILLIGVLFTKPINNARSWYDLKLFLFQPAELVKVLLIIFIAYLISRSQGAQLDLKNDIIPIGISVFVPFVLVMIQPDLGNAVIYLVILLGMLWIGNIKYSYVLIGIVVFVLSSFLFIKIYDTYHDEIAAFLTKHNSGHWVGRIDTFLYPSEASDDDIYQVRNSKIAIGSGALLGEGYLNGNYVHNRRIPYAYSDSIFVVVGEEFGFVGSSFLILLYFILLYRMILISIQSHHLIGSYIIIGIVCMFVFQIFENIGMLLGIMPLTGITLPFISYGGSSLMINMMSIGIVMSVKIHQQEEAEY